MIPILQNHDNAADPIGRVEIIDGLIHFEFEKPMKLSEVHRIFGDTGLQINRIQDDKVLSGIIRTFSLSCLNISDDTSPVGNSDPKPGTYLYEVKKLWKAASVHDKDFLEKLYDHLNALYVEQRIYKS